MAPQTLPGQPGGEGMGCVGVTIGGSTTSLGKDQEGGFCLQTPFYRRGN